MTGQTSPFSVIQNQGIRKHPVKLGNLQLEIISLPGLADWELSMPSARLVAENVAINPTSQVLLFGCQQGILAAYMGHFLPPGQLSVTDNTYTALEATRMTLSTNNILSIDILTDVDLPGEYTQKYSIVIILIPKGRLLNRRWLVQAYQAISPEGDLYLAGSNRAGIQSAIKDAQELFGRGRILAYKKGNRLAHFVRKSDINPVPEWADSPGIAPHTWVEFSVTLSNNNYLIRSLPGIFSYDRLDAGTAMLLDAVQIPPGVKVLDAGCGYGIIGLNAAVQGAGSVHLVDNNLFAVAACKETLSINGIHNVQVYSADLLSKQLMDKYDLVLSNPPFHTGHAVDYQVARAMITNSFQALNPNGRLVVVANRFIRYDRVIKEIYGNVSILAESDKFHVLSGLKSS